MILGSERASSNEFPMPFLQSREICFRQAGQESRHRRTLLQSLRSTVPDWHKLLVLERTYIT